MEHHFNIKIAQKFGVEEAILIHNIYFCIKKNEANKKHFYDGEYWTYNSIEAFTELFPYWTKRQLERIIKSAVEKGALIKGNYNKISYDRTSWYAITQTVKSIYANGEMEITKQGNGFTQTVTPIPDSNTDSKQDKKTYNKQDKIDFDVFWDLYDKKVGSKEKCKKKWNKLSLQTQNKIIETLPRFKKSVSDKKFLPYPETYLNNNRWDDEIEEPKKTDTPKGPNFITIF